MSEPTAQVTVDLRIPGTWSHPRELVERMPAGCRFTPDALYLPDETRVDLGFMDADDQFPRIFRASCRRPPADDELAAVDHYAVNILLSGAGGSMEAARGMMRAGAAIVHAGGAGVFIDNSALAHGGQHWLELTDDGGPEALSFAFVAIIRGDAEVFTMGMHVLGLRDIVMKRDDIERHGFDIVEVIRYLSRGERPVDDGHVLADLNGPQFQVFRQDSPDIEATAMHNPFGRFKLVSMRDVGQAN